jgi:hypothetical protein
MALLGAMMTLFVVMTVSVVTLDVRPHHEYAPEYKALLSRKQRGPEEFAVYASAKQHLALLTEEPTGMFTIYDGSRATTSPWTFDVESEITPSEFPASGFKVTWVDDSLRGFIYVPASGAVLMSTPGVEERTVRNLPQVSFKTGIPEPSKNLLMSIAGPIAVVIAMVGTQLYRFEDFVGRIAIPSLSIREVSMWLLVVTSLMAVFLLRSLHLPGSFGPGGSTAVVASARALIATSTVCATTGFNRFKYKGADKCLLTTSENY